MKLKILLLTALLFTGGFSLHAQKVALKSNLLYGGATLTPNLGMEIGLGKRSTLDFSGSYNPWNREGSFEDNKKLVHWLGNIEYRWWTCQSFNGHFFGVHALGGEYNVAGRDIPLLFDKEYRYEGWAAGGGLSWGYHMMLATRWSLEFNVGAGYVYMNYDRFPCDKCGGLEGNYTKHYFGPTRAGVSLVFFIK